jgi:hypothetical protein
MYHCRQRHRTDIHYQIINEALWPFSVNFIFNCSSSFRVVCTSWQNLITFFLIEGRDWIWKCSSDNTRTLSGFVLSVSTIDTKGPNCSYHKNVLGTWQIDLLKQQLRILIWDIFVSSSRKFTSPLDLVRSRTSSSTMMIDSMNFSFSVLLCIRWFCICSTVVSDHAWDLWKDPQHALYWQRISALFLVHPSCLILLSFWDNQRHVSNINLEDHWRTDVTFK